LTNHTLPVHTHKTKLKEMPPPNKKWKTEFAVDAALMAYAGATNVDIAKTFLVEYDTFQKWTYKHAILKHALDTARAKGRPKTETFLEYVHGNLSPPMKKLWDDLQFWSDHDNAVVKIEELLYPHGDRVRQHLWLHAMIYCGFHTDAACRMVAVSKGAIDRWLAEDNDFPKLLAELEWHKKNYFENAMVDLVGMRVFPAVIHANKTVNRDRGYGEKIEVAHTHDHTHKVFIATMDKLKLPLETRLQIRDAMRALREETGEDDIEMEETGT